MKSLFNLTHHSSHELDCLDLAVQSGIQSCKTFKLYEPEEILNSWTIIIQAARTQAIERESEEWAAKTAKEIVESTK